MGFRQTIGIPDRRLTSSTPPVPPRSLNKSRRHSHSLNPPDPDSDRASSSHSSNHSAKKNFEKTLLSPIKRLNPFSKMSSKDPNFHTTSISSASTDQASQSDQASQVDEAGYVHQAGQADQADDNASVVSVTASISTHIQNLSLDSTNSTMAHTTNPATMDIPVDNNLDSENEYADSAIAQELDRTVSLTSSIMSFKEINGRTYQSFSENSDYWGPNDDKQNEGLNLTHNMLQVLMDGALFTAPICDNPENVIDVGTGTGVWAIEFADLYPQANVIGTDLSPIQPSWVPPNLRFELDDAQKPWDYPDNYFDFVHIRVLLGSIKDWPALYKEIFRVLKPGGYFEHFDFSYIPKSDDGTVKENNGWAEYSRHLVEAGEKMGQTFRVIDDSRNVGWFKDAGFEDINETRYKVPIGGWPADPKYKMIGYLNYVVNDTDLDGYGTYFFTKVNNWSEEKISRIIDKCRAELHNRAIHVYFDGSSVYGRKPLNAGKVPSSPSETSTTNA